MDTSTLVSLAILVGILVIAISSQNWKAAIQTGLVIVLVEGAIRKWVLPSASELVYFIKDFVFLGGYIGYFRQNKVPLSIQWPHLPITTILVCCAYLSLNALNPNIGSPLAAGIGLRGYIFYMPLCFLVPQLFDTKEQLIRKLSYYGLLAIPICILGFAQYRSDSFSVINTYASGISEHGASTFGVSENVRITGTFSYLSGHSTFVQCFFGLTIVLVCAEKVPFRIVHLFVTLPFLVANGLMSGSRACFLSLCLVSGGFLIMSIQSSNSRIRKSVAFFVFAMAIATISIALFSKDAFENSLGRLMGAGDTFYDRTVTSTQDHILLAFERGGIFGCGIGTTSPAVESLRVKLNIPPPDIHPGYYDGEMGQVVAEIGILGFFAWYLLRLLIILALIKSYRSTTDSTLSTLALVALLVNLPYILVSLVLNHVACVLVWSLTGLGLIPLLNTNASINKAGAMRDLNGVPMPSLVSPNHGFQPVGPRS